MSCQIYYCIDINGWYIDKMDEVNRDRPTFTDEKYAVDYFIININKFLKDQKEMTLAYGQKHWSEEDYCVLEITDCIYHINKNGVVSKRMKNMFTTDDIKAGYLLEINDGRCYIVNYNERNILGIGRKIDSSDNEGYCDLMNFDTNLCNNWRKIKINKIYGRTFNGNLDYASPEGRKLLWSREDYKVGDKFIIDRISVTHVNKNGYRKDIDYKNVESTITNICNYNGINKYSLCFDGNLIFVEKEYFDKLQKI